MENSKLQKLYREFDIVFSCLGMNLETEEIKKNDTEKVKTSLKNLMTEILNGHEERIPKLSMLHIATGEILQRTKHSDKRKDMYVQRTNIANSITFLLHLV